MQFHLTHNSKLITSMNMTAAKLFLWVGIMVMLTHLTLCKKKKKASCPPFPHTTLENGQIIAVEKDKFQFRCNRGYFLSSPPVVRCWRGKWSSVAEPKCSRKEGQCDDPPPVHGSEVYGDEREVGATIQYVCLPGYILIGSGKRTCLESGYWDGITPTCMEESEPLQSLAERLKDKFITEVGVHSNDSILPKELDRKSLKEGLELVILIDRSSSIDPEDFKIGKDFLKFLFREFGVRNGNNTTGTRATVIAFGSEADIIFNVDDANIAGPVEADRALDQLEANGGGTALEKALLKVALVTEGLRRKAKKAIFLLTDGEPNIGSEGIDPEHLAQILKSDAGFEIFTVGIGRGINRQLLSDIASKPPLSHVFILDKYSDLQAIMKIIKNRPPEAPAVDPGRCGYVKNKQHHLKVWPWLAAIYVAIPNNASKPRLSFCGGTLICRQWVLTAASCFYHVEKNETDENIQINTQEVFVSLGEEDLRKEDSNQLNFYATDVIIHPKFREPNGLQDNLALIKLNAPAPMGQFRPACLPPTEKPVHLHLDLNINTSIAGWGLPPDHEHDRDIHGGTTRVHLLSKSVALEEEDTCVQTSGRAARVNIFCAGTGADTCIGDLGSPIIAVDPSTHLHHILGVLSKRLKCKLGHNQYSELTQYVNWIDDVTNKCQQEHYMA
ncbi:Complement factor B, partial [Stegodyphus mimosarum]